MVDGEEDSLASPGDVTTYGLADTSCTLYTASAGDCNLSVIVWENGNFELSELDAQLGEGERVVSPRSERR